MIAPSFPSYTAQLLLLAKKIIIYLRSRLPLFYWLSRHTIMAAQLPTQPYVYKLSEHLFLLRITDIWLASLHGVVEFSSSLRYRNWKKSDKNASCNEIYQISPPNDWKMTKTLYFSTRKQRYIFIRNAAQHGEACHNANIYFPRLQQALRKVS